MRDQRRRQKAAFVIEKMDDWLAVRWPSLEDASGVLADRLHKLACRWLGHIPIRECVDRDHDHCAWCQASTPGEGR